MSCIADIPEADALKRRFNDIFRSAHRAGCEFHSCLFQGNIHLAISYTRFVKNSADPRGGYMVYHTLTTKIMSTEQFYQIGVEEAVLQTVGSVFADRRSCHLAPRELWETAGLQAADL